MWFSKLDATWGYWQIKVKDDDKCKTAFTTNYGLFQFKRFDKCIKHFFQSHESSSQMFTLENLLAFLDDVLVLGRSFKLIYRTQQMYFKDLENMESG